MFVKTPSHGTSQAIIDAAGIKGVPKRRRDRIVKDIIDKRLFAICPPLSKTNVKKRLA